MKYMYIASVFVSVILAMFFNLSLYVIEFLILFTSMFLVLQIPYFVVMYPPDNSTERVYRTLKISMFYTVLSLLIYSVLFVFHVYNYSFALLSLPCIFYCLLHTLQGL